MTQIKLLQELRGQLEFDYIRPALRWVEQAHTVRGLKQLMTHN
jgi:uncharacterized protein YjiS (DUF1127 family)